MVASSSPNTAFAAAGAGVSRRQAASCDATAAAAVPLARNFLRSIMPPASMPTDRDRHHHRQAPERGENQATRKHPLEPVVEADTGYREQCEQWPARREEQVERAI